MMIKQLVSVDSTGTKRAAMIWLPADYDTNPELCPLLVFNHGTGETGDGTLGTVDKLLVNGSPLAVANSNGNMTFTNPFDKKNYRYIVVGLQGVGGWCCYSDQVTYVVQSMIKSYKIDTNAIFVTGLSAGGETTWESIGSSTGSLFAGAVPMSTPAINTGLVDWSRDTAKVWAFHGTIDGGATDYYNSKRYVDALNSVHPGYAYLTSYSNGHCCWGTYYNPSYRESFTTDWDSNGKPYPKSLNIYELLLAFKKGQKFLFNSTSTTTPMATTNAAFIITIEGNTVTIDPSTSTVNGTWQSFDISFADSTGKYYKPPTWTSGLNTANGSAPNKVIVSGFPDGNYYAKLLVQDKSGVISTITKQFTIATTTSTTTTPPTAKTLLVSLSISGKTIKIYSDFSTEVI